MQQNGRTVARGPCGHIHLTFRFYQEDGQWVAECEELGVSSCGATLDEAVRNLREATDEYLNAIEEEGQRERIFREAGIRVLAGPPPLEAPPRTVQARPDEYVTAAVMPLLRTGRITVDEFRAALR